MYGCQQDSQIREESLYKSHVINVPIWIDLCFLQQFISFLFRHSLPQVHKYILQLSLRYESSPLPIEDSECVQRSQFSVSISNIIFTNIMYFSTLLHFVSHDCYKLREIN